MNYYKFTTSFLYIYPFLGALKKIELVSRNSKPHSKLNLFDNVTNKVEL